MSYLNKMYGRKQPNDQPSPTANKNPNRVSGGLKGQGVDHIVMVSEDGAENQIPTQRYVQSLEDQIRKQRSAITVLERKLARQTKTLESLDTFVRSR
jgi:hypothetical protein|tara:strand:+ start:523 stop:813 length:291 start_codon:yes stop_codon:yes gene_type:complete